MLARASAGTASHACMRPPQDSQWVPAAVSSPPLPDPWCQLLPALGSATPGHSYHRATWNPAPRPMLSEPPLPPGSASCFLPVRQLSSPCPRCHPGPRAPCAHCQTPSERPGHLGAILSLSHPRCWVSSTPFNHVSLISAHMPAALRPRGSWPLPSASAPMSCPVLGDAMAVHGAGRRERAWVRETPSLQPHSGTTPPTPPCRGGAGGSSCTCSAAVDPACHL